jgi:uncharacterized membrane protein
VRCALAGLDPSGRTKRRERAAALRQDGHSTRSIAAALGAHREHDRDRLAPGEVARLIAAAKYQAAILGA